MSKPSLFNPNFLDDLHAREHRSRDSQAPPWACLGSSSILFVIYSIREKCHLTEILIRQKVENWTKNHKTGNWPRLSPFLILWGLKKERNLLSLSGGGGNKQIN